MVIIDTVRGYAVHIDAPRSSERLVLSLLKLLSLYAPDLKIECWVGRNDIKLPLRDIKFDGHPTLRVVEE